MKKYKNTFFLYSYLLHVILPLLYVSCNNQSSKCEARIDNHLYVILIDISKSFNKQKGFSYHLKSFNLFSESCDDVKKLIADTSKVNGGDCVYVFFVGDKNELTNSQLLKFDLSDTKYKAIDKDPSMRSNGYYMLELRQRQCDLNALNKSEIQKMRDTNVIMLDNLRTTFINNGSDKTDFFAAVKNSMEIFSDTNFSEKTLIIYSDLKDDPLVKNNSSEIRLTDVNVLCRYYPVSLSTDITNMENILKMKFNCISVNILPANKCIK